MPYSIFFFSCDNQKYNKKQLKRETEQKKSSRLNKEKRIPLIEAKKKQMKHHF